MRASRAALFAGSAIVLLLTVVALLAPVLAPHDPRAFDGGALEAPSLRHPLGTNELGQDLLSQLVWGTRSALALPLAAIALATALGTLLGAGPALVGGAVDAVAMRSIDVFLAIPGLPLVIVIASVLGTSQPVMIGLIALAVWPLVARTLRGRALSLRQRGFVAAARGFGGGPVHVLHRHLLPGLAPLVVTAFFGYLSFGIFLEAGLAFLGLGDPTAVSWGLMLNRALGYPGLYFTSLWTWSVLPPGLAITLAVLGFTLLGVGLESRFNPALGRVG